MLVLFCTARQYNTLLITCKLRSACTAVCDELCRFLGLHCCLLRALFRGRGETIRHSVEARKSKSCLKTFEPVSGGRSSRVGDWHQGALEPGSVQGSHQQDHGRLPGSRHPATSPELPKHSGLAPVTAVAALTLPEAMAASRKPTTAYQGQRFV